MQALFRRLDRLGPDLYFVTLTRKRLSQAETGAPRAEAPLSVVLLQGDVQRADTMASCLAAGSLGLRCSE